MASPPTAERSSRKTGNPISELIRAFYALLCDPSFAIFVIITLAVASILSMVIVDQLPFRGEMARMRFAERLDEPWIWFLVNVIPEHPYRSAVFRTLLAMLSLSLLACIIKRWRFQWGQALSNPLPNDERFESARTVGWVSRTAVVPSEIAAFFRSRLFKVDVESASDSMRLAATRFGIARVGPILTHVGFLLLVIGGLLMASTGSSGMLWMRPGDWVEIPNTDVRLEVLDFEIEKTERGQIADYIATVQLVRDTTVIKNHRLEVNKPLRYAGYSFYQASYRSDPTSLRTLQLVFDVPLDGEAIGGSDAQESSSTMPPEMKEMMPHGQKHLEFHNPQTLSMQPGERITLPNTSYTAEIDTFFTDFRMGQDGPAQGSPEARNPAVRLGIYKDGVLLGYRWHFLFHPDMAIGSGPELPIRFASFDGVMQTGLEMSTHPGSAWVWAGLAIMTLGTLMAFLIRHERVLLRARRRGEDWEIDWIHTGTGNQDPALVDHPWQAAVSSLAARFMDTWKPEQGGPQRWPGQETSNSGE